MHTQGRAAKMGALFGTLWKSDPKERKPHASPLCLGQVSARQGWGPALKLHLGPLPFRLFQVQGGHRTVMTSLNFAPWAPHLPASQK